MVIIYYPKMLSLTQRWAHDVFMGPKVSSDKTTSLLGSLKFESINKSLFSQLLSKISHWQQIILAQSRRIYRCLSPKKHCQIQYLTKVEPWSVYKKVQKMRIERWIKALLYVFLFFLLQISQLLDFKYCFCYYFCTVGLSDIDAKLLGSFKQRNHVL